MQIEIVEARPEVARNCEPLTCERAVGQCPVGPASLDETRRALLQQELASAGLADSDTARTLFVWENAWISPGSIKTLLEAGTGGGALCAADQRVLAWTGDDPRNMPVYGSGEDFCADEESFLIDYPWDLLRANELYMTTFHHEDVQGEVTGNVVSEGVLAVGEGSRLLPGVFIEGNVVIGRDCKIGPNCYLRGNTVIGDRCHIGQAVEIKNSVIMAGTSIAHLSYCGDSLLGQGVNFGAGTIVANLRHDDRCHRSMVRGELMATGRRKFGTVVGDRVHTGIHTSIYPGRKLWPGKYTRPHEVVTHDLC